MIIISKFSNQDFVEQKESFLDCRGFVEFDWSFVPFLGLFLFVILII